MSKIHVLPDALISQIAAGEVVDRPASVVKELIENSLDAGASRIAVEAEQGGMKLICVRDNGGGMDSQDAMLAFSRHATSKIASFEDLGNIGSFGFRGEALAAIAAVSSVEMRTREHDVQEGTEIVVSGGKFQSRRAAGCPPGTEIVARNLFFNTPARRKFLKSETTELGYIVSIVTCMALSNPSAAFDMKHNGKEIFSLPAASPQARAAALLGKRFFDEVMPVYFQTPSINIHGFIGQPGMARSQKKHQYLFINGRDVMDNLVSRAIADAYGSRLPARFFPVFVIHIDIDPHEVDVNVHPRKLTVKFLDTRRVYRDVSQAVSQALVDYEAGMSVLRSAPRPPLFAEKQPSVQEALVFSGRIAGGLGVRAEDFKYADAGQQTGTPVLLSPADAKILCQIANSYIAVLREEGIMFIDQHAAHERVLYERFSARAKEAKTESQQLLVPASVECTREEAVFLRQAMEHLSKLGFEFDEWSGGTFVIRACPKSLQKENLEKIFREFLDEMMSGQNEKDILPERILKSLACKAAVKFGMKMAVEEMQKLIDELAETSNNSTCPHGRPVRVTIGFEELERRFYRRG